MQPFTGLFLLINIHTFNPAKNIIKKILNKLVLIK